VTDSAVEAKQSVSAEEPQDELAGLEEEGEIAADYLEGLLDIADLDGDIDMDVEGDRAAVSIVGSGLDQLIGQSGEVLEALQELTRLAVTRETGERTRLMLDIAGTGRPGAPSLSGSVPRRPARCRRPASR
jgi:spoIIIJ-associated protein